MVTLFPFARKITDKKQIKYGGLHARMCATLIDLFCCVLLLFPLFHLLQPLFYNGVDPQAVLSPILKDAAKELLEAKQMSLGNYLSKILHDERTYKYFITEGGLVRSLLDQFTQIGISMGLVLFLWMRVSATPGKMALSLKIVDAETYSTPTRKQFLIRFFSYILSAIPLGLGFLWVAFDKKKQGWHDKLANTVVVKK